MSRCALLILAVSLLAPACGATHSPPTPGAETPEPEAVEPGAGAASEGAPAATPTEAAPTAPGLPAPLTSLGFVARTVPDDLAPAGAPRDLERFASVPASARVRLVVDGEPLPLGEATEGVAAYPVVEERPEWVRVVDQVGPVALGLWVARIDLIPRNPGRIVVYTNPDGAPDFWAEATAQPIGWLATDADFTLDGDALAAGAEWIPVHQALEAWTAIRLDGVVRAADLADVYREGELDVPAVTHRTTRATALRREPDAAGPVLAELGEQVPVLEVEASGEWAQIVALNDELEPSLAVFGWIEADALRPSGRGGGGSADGWFRAPLAVPPGDAIEVPADTELFAAIQGAPVGRVLTTSPFPVVERTAAGTAIEVPSSWGPVTVWVTGTE